jgi:hypothetical protein
MHTPLTSVQVENLARFQKKLPNGIITIYDLPAGGKAFQCKVLGKVHGSYAVYEKQVDFEGVTLFFTKTTYLADGTIAHVKQKYP